MTQNAGVCRISEKILPYHGTGPETTCRYFCGENNGRSVSAQEKTAQTESLEQLKEILEAQGEQQQELLEEMSGNIRELSRNAQKGKFGLFR